jgi:hypothetical protein
MFAGPPLPLHPSVRLEQLVALGSGVSGLLGVWVRGVRRPLGLHAASRGRRCRMLLSQDLGLLLRRCGYIGLREGHRPRIVSAEQLIHWRALQVITGCPHLHQGEPWHRIFPEAYPEPNGFRVPLESRPPEEVLADCLAHGIEVKGTDISYNPAPAPLRLT